MTQYAIKTQSLTRRFNQVQALSNINLEVEPGNIIALLGPNGAGKTTFIRLLMGLIEPSEGEAKVLGQDSRALTSKISRRIGYMADTAEPPKWLTVNQLLSLKAAVASDFDYESIERLLDVHPESTYGILSKGQKRWVMAVAALAARPDLMLMDEPAEGLDPSARRVLYNHLRDYVSESQATAVVTTHVISDIERVADRVAILNEGELVLHGSLEDLRDQVREIRFPMDQEPLDWPESVEILGHRKDPHELIFWVRCAPETLRAMPLDHAQLHPVSLGDLYLLITEKDKDKGKLS